MRHCVYFFACVEVIESRLIDWLLAATSTEYLSNYCLAEQVRNKALRGEMPLTSPGKRVATRKVKMPLHVQSSSYPVKARRFTVSDTLRAHQLQF